MRLVVRVGSPISKNDCSIDSRQYFAITEVPVCAVCAKPLTTTKAESVPLGCSSRTRPEPTRDPLS